MEHLIYPYCLFYQNKWSLYHLHLLNTNSAKNIYHYLISDALFILNYLTNSIFYNSKVDPECPVLTFKISMFEYAIWHYIFNIYYYYLFSAIFRLVEATDAHLDWHFSLKSYLYPLSEVCWQHLSWVSNCHIR